LWAHDIAHGENFHDIIVEGDAKVCIDSIMGTAGVVPWKLQSLVANVEEVALSYNSCSFLWVCRTTNSLVHSLAKFASSQPSCFHSNNSNLLPSVHKAWIRDLNSLSV
jgi:hypothetical protein